MMTRVKVKQLTFLYLKYNMTNTNKEVYKLYINIKSLFSTSKQSNMSSISFESYMQCVWYFNPKVKQKNILIKKHNPNFSCG